VGFLLFLVSRDREGHASLLVALSPGFASSLKTVRRSLRLFSQGGHFEIVFDDSPCSIGVTKWIDEQRKLPHLGEVLNKSAATRRELRGAARVLLRGSEE